MTTPTTHDSDIPAFPMARAARCPFDPAPGQYTRRDEGPLTKVRLWDGSTPWFVTRYDDQRALLADPPISCDADPPRFPRTLPPPPGGGKRHFIGMGDPEHARQQRKDTPPVPGQP